MSETLRIGCLGAGKMATALAYGWIQAGLLAAEHVCASDPLPAARENFHKAVGVAALPDNLPVVAASNLIVLAVKPQSMPALLKEIRKKISGSHLIVSIAAGVATLVWPSITLWALAVVIGIALIFRGVMRVMASIMGRPPIWGFWLVVGLIELAAGVLALVWPEITILALAVVIGIDLLIVGLVGLAAAVRSRRLIA